MLWLKLSDAKFYDHLNLPTSISNPFDSLAISLIQNLTWIYILCREEDGVTPLEIVFTAKQQGGDHQHLWKNSYYLLEF